MSGSYNQRDCYLPEEKIIQLTSPEQFPAELNYWTINNALKLKENTEDYLYSGVLIYESNFDYPAHYVMHLTSEFAHYSIKFWNQYEIWVETKIRHYNVNSFLGYDSGTAFYKRFNSIYEFIEYAKNEELQKQDEADKNTEIKLYWIEQERLQEEKRKRAGITTSTNTGKYMRPGIYINEID